MCRNTAGGWRRGRPIYAATPRRNGLDTSCADEKEDVPISAYSDANKGWQEIFLGPAGALPSSELDGILECLSKIPNYELITAECTDERLLKYL